MNTVTSTSTMGSANAILGLVATLLLGAVLTGFNQSLNLSARGAFWLLFIIGMTMCALGPLGQGADLGWWNPRHNAGYVLGVSALLLGAAVLFDLSLPLVNSPRAAVLALGLLMAIKVVVALLYPRVR